jgi:hypothetical protein
MSETLTLLLNQIVQVLPRLASALFVFIVGYIVVRIISKTIIKLLEKIKIDTFGEKLNEIGFIEKANITVKLSQIFGKIIYYFLLLLVMIVSADILQLPAISNLVVDVFNFIPKVLVALIILVFGVLLAEIIRKIVLTTLTSLVLPSAPIIANFVFYFLFINVVIVAVSQAGISTGFLEQNISIIIGGGVLAFALGYGLAAKDVMANFLSSFYSNDKVNIGDIITIEGETGQVVEVNKTAIKILSGDRFIYFPLKTLLQNKVIIHNKQLKIE